MPHAYPVCINNVRKHLAELTKYKKRNYEKTQAIKNGFLFTLDFIHSTHLVDHRNYLTPQEFLYTPFFYGLPKTYIPYLLLPPTEASLYLSFVWPLQNLFTLPLPSPSPCHPINNQPHTMSFTSCNLLWEHPHRTSTSAITSYNSFNLSHFLLIIPSHSLSVCSFTGSTHCILYHKFHPLQLQDKSS